MTNICRSLLFAPGSRPEIFAKTLVAGADLVAIDLEDAVAPALKADARIAGIRFLGESDGTGPRRALRMNALDTAFGLTDLVAVPFDQTQPVVIKSTKLHGGPFAFAFN